jgi:hypothetical protein
MLAPKYSGRSWTRPLLANLTLDEVRRQGLTTDDLRPVSGHNRFQLARAWRQTTLPCFARRRRPRRTVDALLPGAWAAARDDDRVAHSHSVIDGVGRTEERARAGRTRSLALEPLRHVTSSGASKRAWRSCGCRADPIYMWGDKCMDRSEGT